MPNRATFSDTEKEEKSFNYFEQGVHKIQISSLEFGFTEDKDEKEYCEITVVDPDNGEKTDKVRLWFHSEGARGFSFSTLRAIFVHNAPEDKKDEIREKFNAIKGTEDLEKACQKMLPGKEAWFSIYESDTRTYQDEKGNVRKSFDKNLTGYEPKPRNTAPKTATVGSGDAKIEGEVDESGDQPFGF